MVISNVSIDGILLISILLTASAGISQAGTREPSPSVGKWDVFEINLTTINTYANPYLDIWLNATFNGPNSTKIRIDGFWMGEITGKSEWLQQNLAHGITYKFQ